MVDGDIWVAVLGLADEDICATRERCLGTSLSARRLACESFWGCAPQLVCGSILVADWRCSVFCCVLMGSSFRDGNLFVRPLSQQ